MLVGLFNELVIDRDSSNWTNGSLLDIAEYRNGLAMQKYRPDQDDRGLPVLKIRELREGTCGPESERCSSDIDEDIIVNDGDVVFSWSGSLLVDIWAGGKVGLNQHLFKVSSSKYDEWFYYLWTDHYLGRFISMAADRATTMGHIKRSALKQAVVKIPDKRSMANLSRLFSPLLDEFIANKIQSKQLEHLRDALLTKLMSGEIDISKVEVPTPPNSHLSAVAHTRT